VQPIHTLDTLRAITDDSLLLWTAQGMRPGARAWAAGNATAVATADVARRDRLVVNGPITDAAPLIKAVLAEVGPRFRLLGDAALLTGLCERLPELSLRGALGWMHTTVAPAADPLSIPATPDDEPLINELLAESLPASLARPGMAGVARWWVIRDEHGAAACAADAWSSPDVGLLGGVATALRAQGTGLGKAVVKTALAGLVAEHCSVGLLVDEDNHRARHVYETLGMTYRPLHSAVPE